MQCPTKPRMWWDQKRRVVPPSRHRRTNTRMSVPTRAPQRTHASPSLITIRTLGPSHGGRRRTFLDDRLQLARGADRVTSRTTRTGPRWDGGEFHLRHLYSYTKKPVRGIPFSFVKNGNTAQLQMPEKVSWCVAWLLRRSRWWPWSPCSMVGPPKCFCSTEGGT